MSRCRENKSNKRDGVGSNPHGTIVDKPRIQRSHHILVRYGTVLASVLVLSYGSELFAFEMLDVK